MISFLAGTRQDPQLVTPGPLYLGCNSLSEAAAFSFDMYSKRNRGKHLFRRKRVIKEKMDEFLNADRTIYPPILALLAYLGSTHADIVDTRDRPIPEPRARTRHAPPLESVKNYQVGLRIGPLLRKGPVNRHNSSSESVHSDRTVMPHLRKAHWHHYWTGPKSDPDQRKLVVRWIHPVFVGQNETTPVVRRVVNE